MCGPARRRHRKGKLMNTCPNCGLPLLLVDSQGKRLYKCDVQWDVSDERRSQTTPSIMTGITTRPIDRENADPMGVKDYEYFQRVYAGETPGVSQRFLWWCGGLMSLMVILLVAWLIYSQLTS